MKAGRLVAATALLCAGALVAGLANQPLVLGCCSIALIAVLAVLGMGSGASAATRLAVFLFGVLFCVLISLSFLLNAPDQPLVTVGGFPPGTAVLVYAIGPLGLILGLIYGLSFDKQVLPEERLRSFVDRFSRK